MRAVAAAGCLSRVGGSRNRAGRPPSRPAVSSTWVPWAPLPLDVRRRLRRRRGIGGGHLADDGGNIDGGGTDRIEVREVETRSADTSLAGDELETDIDGTQEDGLDHSLCTDRAGEIEEVHGPFEGGNALSRVLVRQRGLSQEASHIPEGSDLKRLLLRTRKGFAGNPLAICAAGCWLPLGQLEGPGKRKSRARRRHEPGQVLRNLVRQGNEGVGPWGSPVFLLARRNPFAPLIDCTLWPTDTAFGDLHRGWEGPFRHFPINRGSG